jgi:branched-chain amino acid transport system permease protein
MTRFILRIGVVALALLLPRLMYPTLAVEILCGGLFALAFDLVFGYVGLLSFGHAAFWGTASYVAANVLVRTSLPVPVAILAGAVAAFVISIPVGYLSIRSSGIYFSMITLAFAEMIHFVALQADQWTGGDNGIPGIPRRPFLGIDFSDSLQLYYFALFFIAIGFWIAWRAIGSPFGQALRAIRDVGAGVVRVLEHFLASSTAAVGIVTGAVFVVTVLFFRRGIVGSLLALDHWFAARSQAKTPGRQGEAAPSPGEVRAKS